MNDHCEECGAVRFSWVGGPHHCHAKFVRQTWENGRRIADVPEPHSVEEYERGYLATGNQFFQFWTKP